MSLFINQCPYQAERKIMTKITTGTLNRRTFVIGEKLITRSQIQNTLRECGWQKTEVNQVQITRSRIFGEVVCRTPMRPLGYLEISVNNILAE